MFTLIECFSVFDGRLMCKRHGLPVSSRDSSDVVTLVTAVIGTHMAPTILHKGPVKVLTWDS